MVWQLWFYRLHWLFFHSVAANTSFSHFFGLFFPNTKRVHCAFLGGDSNQCPNPQHSKPFWTSASSPKPSFLLLFFFLLVKQNQNNLFVAFWTQTDEGAREKPEKENSINSLSLVRQQKPASYPHAFWSEEVKMEAQSSSWALHLQRLPLLHTDVTCCSGPGIRGETAGPVAKQSAQNGYCKYTCWHNAACWCILLCAFPHCLPGFQQQ